MKQEHRGRCAPRGGIRMAVLMRRGWLFAIIAPVLLTGCITPHPAAEFPVAMVDRGELSPGDVVNILFPYWQELSTKQPVRPDGKIGMNLIGDIQAAGRTPEELRRDLITAYADKINGPEVTVTVEEYKSRRVFVGGEVRNPGVYPLLDPKMSVMEAIMQAGGQNNFSARITKVLLVREREGKRYAKVVDLQHDMSQPIHDPVALEPRDIIYVPRTAIDRVNQAVEQYVNKVIPSRINWNVMTYGNSQRISGGGGGATANFNLGL